MQLGMLIPAAALLLAVTLTNAAALPTPGSATTPAKRYCAWGNYCTPGSYECSSPTPNAILVCDDCGEFLVAANCGINQHCVMVQGLPYCQ